MNISDAIKLKKNLKKYLEIGRLYYGTEEGKKFLLGIIHYLFNTSDIDDDVINTIKEVSKEGGEAAMTLAMKLKERGKAEGKIEGKIEGKVEDAKKMLEDRLPIEKIMFYTGLSREQIENL